MTEIPDRLSVLIKIAEDAARCAAAEYDDCYRSFAGLDGKAQSAATVAGVVVAALVAFTNATRLTALLEKPGSLWLHVLLIATVLGALFTVIMSVVAMRVRDAVVPFAAEEQILEVEELAMLQDDSLSADRVFRYYRGRLNHWKTALEDMEGHIDSKGRWVFATQTAIAVTLALLLTLFLFIVYLPIAIPASAP